MNKIKVNDKTNDRVKEMINFHPDYLLRCKVIDIMRERGLTLNELGDLTGIRIASLSELINMRRSTISITHILVIAKVLRITDINELFEFIMHDKTREEFEADKALIQLNGSMLPEQDEYLYWKRREDKLIAEFNKLTGFKPKKKKPTVR